MARWIIFFAVLCIVNVTVWGQTEVNYSFRCDLKGNTSSMVHIYARVLVVGNYCIQIQPASLGLLLWERKYHRGSTAIVFVIRK